MLAWIDIETTGLEPTTCNILEVAIVVTDYKLNIIAESPNVYIKAGKETLNNMDSWCRTAHTESGLIDSVIKDGIDIADAENILLDFIRMYIGSNQTPMCGSSVHFDRAFIAQHMPKLEKYFHYRNIDVSTVKELCRIWSVNLEYSKENKHRALSDIQESIEELKLYRAHLWDPV